jgi:hypothetical protein
MLAAHSTKASTDILPATSSFSAGDVLPIPTLPFAVIRSRSTSSVVQPLVQKDKYAGYMPAPLVQVPSLPTIIAPECLKVVPVLSVNLNKIPVFEVGELLALFKANVDKPP